MTNSQIDFKSFLNFEDFFYKSSYTLEQISSWIKFHICILVNIEVVVVEFFTTFLTTFFTILSCTLAQAAGKSKS